MSSGGLDFGWREAIGNASYESVSAPFDRPSVFVSPCRVVLWSAPVLGKRTSTEQLDFLTQRSLLGPVWRDRFLIGATLRRGGI